ncbi:MAG: NAD-glutamate dehydrogenase [Gemmatimonadota bacterium]
MSQATEAAVQSIRAKSPEAGAVCDLLLERVAPDEAGLAVRLAERVFTRARPEFARERSAESLAQLILGILRFLQASRPDRVDVQVINPDLDNEEGWYAPVTVIRTNVSERPFVVDTLREFLHSQGMEIENYIYPMLQVSRTPQGRVYDVRPPEDHDLESLIHCEVGRVTDPETLEFLEAEIRRRLTDVVAATDDFGSMITAANRVVDRLSSSAQDLPSLASELQEIEEFLRWLRDGGFVFLGYRAYRIEGDPTSPEKRVQVEDGSGLGILRDESSSSFARPVPVSQIPSGMRPFVDQGPTLIISKTNAESTVHRRARMDYIGVKRLDQGGRIVGEDRFLGLFTSKAFGEDAARIPILRTKLQEILSASGVNPGSHDYKEIITIFNSMPKEDLFLSPASVVGSEIQTILKAYHTHDVRVATREDRLGRGGVVTVILPRERFSAEVRKNVEALLKERFAAEVLNYHLALGSGDQARLHFSLAAPPDRFHNVDREALEHSVLAIIVSWADRVAEELAQVRSPDEARRLGQWYGEAFSREYRVATDAGTAIREILEIEAMIADGRSESILLWNPAEEGDGERWTSLNLYLRGSKLVLSDFMPILDNMRLRVLGVTPFDLTDSSGVKTVIYAFQVQGSDGSPITISEVGTLLSDALLAVRAGDASNDALNALVVKAGLTWREVEVLRAYATYAFQLGAVPSRQILPATLIRYPDLAALLLEAFRTAFNPDGPPDRESRNAELETIEARFRSSLKRVDSLAEDRVLRNAWTLVRATVRTNYYRHGGRAATGRSGGVPYISLKFDCTRMPDLTRHRLLYEVWVRSPRMEGVHLRGAKVARGGIRWSDRPDDFRTEILGLVKTQMVKNAVIVPAGSKGGFVTLRRFDDREAQAEEARTQYQTLIRGLLDLTDNLVDGHATTPAGVYAHDDPDPYLVVAADKGTATFSDVANAISAEYGFWLGDAFASGGSNGYDHKAVGITARGAWECVKRHFREKGKDIQSEPFTVVGIGDMSGDVFGNGMLLSRQIRLLAAFDHRHIFIDPDPDPERSFLERERMFKLGRSSWADYDRTVMSPGAMLVPRGAKEVELTPEARSALGLTADVPVGDGEALVRAILKAPVELLWNGGIGTYVKASGESHANAGDPPNDAVRIDAPELHAEVVGEGGNLGLTQRARVEYALRGGRLNTDALDNSGGVDLSDHEVNLKILLNALVTDGRLGLDGRNQLLEDLTDEVADAVLADNDSQSLAVSLDELRAGESLDDFRHLISGLEREGLLDRAAETLPTWEELSERRDRNQSLTRPELAVLLSYAKIHATRATLDSGVPDDPAAASYLVHYFPPRAAQMAGAEVLHGHRLRQEIIAGQLTNDLVDLMGATFVYRLASETGHSAGEVVRAWLISARLADHHRVFKALDERRDLPAATAYAWRMRLARVFERTTRWVLENANADEAVATIVERNAASLEALRRAFPDVVRGFDKSVYEQRVAEAVSQGADPAFARDVITLRYLDHLLEILVIARETKAEAVDAARAFYAASEVMWLPWLRQEIFRTAGHGHWEQRAAQALNGDLGRAHRTVVARLMEMVSEGGVEEALSTLRRTEQRGAARIARLVEEIQTENAQGLAPLSVVVREVSALGRRVGGNGGDARP